MDIELITYAKSDHVARVTINRPEARNALNEQCHRDLRAAFEDFRDDEDMFVAVLTGAGDKAFCAGADLKEAAAMFASGQAPKDPLPWGGITSDFTCYKPIIAAVNGFALGGGTELALACDIVVAADTCAFGLPEPRRGILAGAGGVLRLPRQLPLKQAMGMLLTGRAVPAAEAMRLGLVNEVVPQAELAAAVDRWVADILACSPLSLRLSKQAALGFLDMPLEDALVAQRGQLDELMGSYDAKEGTAAFAEKRVPVWQGR